MQMFFTSLLVKESVKRKKITDKQFHNIFRLFDVLPNFSFTTSETMSDYYL